MPDDVLDPQQVCVDIDAFADKAQATGADDTNTRGECIRHTRERIARFLADLDAATKQRDWNNQEKIIRVAELDRLLEASIEPTHLNETQIYRIARQALPRRRT
jgi:hypothetical protein